MQFEANWKHAWTMVCFIGAARTCIFMEVHYTSHPSNLVHPHLFQHPQGVRGVKFAWT